MLRYFLRRVGAGAGVLGTVAVLVFGLFESLDSDAAVVMLSRRGAGDPSPEQLAALRTELGLDRPAPVRFTEWVTDFLCGDLGESLISGRPVADVLFDRMANSAALALVTVVLLLPLALGLGLLAGSRPGSRTDRAISVAALTIEAIPSFVLGVLLVATAALSLRLLPAVSLVPTGSSVWDRPAVLVLPVLCLLLGLSPHPARIVRAQTTGVMASEYIRTARLNGVGGLRLILRHVAPNAVSASIHPLAGSVVGLIGGIAVVETLFSYPGVSKELLIAISTRDYPFVQSAAVLLAGFGIGVHLLADMLALLVIPRARALVGEGRLREKLGGRSFSWRCWARWRSGRCLRRIRPRCRSVCRFGRRVLHTRWVPMWSVVTCCRACCTGAGRCSRSREPRCSSPTVWDRFWG